MVGCRRVRAGAPALSQPFDTSSILSRSIETTFALFGPLLAVASVLQSPQLVLAALRDAGRFSGGSEAASPWAILGVLLPLMLLTQLQAGLVAPAVLCQLRGEAVGWRHFLPRDPLRLAAMVATAALVALAAGLGFLFFLLPGWVVLTGLFVALPILAVEGVPPVTALSRSWRLTAGRWPSLFALVFMFTVLERLLYFALLWLGAPGVLAAAMAVPISALQAVAASVAYEGLRGPR